MQYGKRHHVLYGCEVWTAPEEAGISPGHGRMLGTDNGINPSCIVVLASDEATADLCVEVLRPMAEKRMMEDLSRD